MITEKLTTEQVNDHHLNRHSHRYDDVVVECDDDVDDDNDVDDDDDVDDNDD